jgi:LacI family transcriptional regulator
MNADLPPVPPSPGDVPSDFAGDIINDLDAGPQSRSTMRDVAALAGVSLKTVSRVINGEPGVSATLSERVRNAARRLDFQPNLTASSLRRNDGKTKSIGLLVQDMANPFSSAMYRAVEDVARSHGVMVFAGSLDEDQVRERQLVSAFVARRVDGLIMVPTGEDQTYLINERRAGTPMVFVDRLPNLPDADAVLSSHVEGTRVAVEHLIAHGHRRIGYLGHPRSISTAVDRYAGYCEALLRAGIALDPSLVRHDLRASGQAGAALDELLTIDEPPTAVFTSQNFVTIGAVGALRHAGRHRDIALVGFDDLLLADVLDPALTLVIQDVRTIGGLAAELLFKRLSGDDGPTQRHLIETTLVTRGSGEIPGPFA